MSKIRASFRTQRRRQTYSPKRRFKVGSPPNFLLRQIPRLNQYKCKFCHGGCERPKHSSAQEYGKYARWQTCWKCNVSFAVGPYLSLKALKLSIRDPENKDNLYQVVVDLKNNQTYINYFEEDKTPRYRGLFFYNSGRNQNQYIFKRLLELPRAINSITPKNLMEKIKLYLLFS